MLTSDFTSAKSMHDYLLRVFLSETGIFGFGVSHTETQYNALCILSFDLKSDLMKDEDVKIAIPGFESVKVAKKDEAILMLEVLSSVNSMLSMVSNTDKVMSLAVYPKITKMINTNDDFKRILLVGYNQLVERYPDGDGKTYDSALALRIRKRIQDDFKITGFFRDDVKNTNGVKL